MSASEIAAAEAFEESALLCQKSREQNRAVFRLEIPDSAFSNLPRSARVVNSNNNMQIATAGELIRLREKRAGQARWRGILPKELPPSRSRVLEYIRRMN